MKVFKIKRGDTSPTMLYQLSPATVVLSGAQVVFNMRADGEAENAVDRSPAVVEVATGTPTVRYDWLAADTVRAGAFQGEFEVTYLDGTVETFPNSGFITIEIAEDLG